MRIMGLDIGNRRIGIALSDPEEILASPLTTLIRDDDGESANSIAGLVQQYGVRRLVIGIPYTLNNLNSEQTNKTKAFKKKLSDIMPSIEIITQDERLTTVMAKRLLHQTGKKKHRRGSDLDAASAALILQAYLDRIKT